MQINEEDKFVFKVIDKVLTELCSEFPQFTRDYIFDLLVSNSMNIGRTYLSLTDHNEKNKLCFTSLDDNVILTMKGSAQYIALIESKGKDLVEEREDFRQISYIRQACVRTITGHGITGYTEAMDYLKENYGA